jgi:hypothetical protein
LPFFILIFSFDSVSYFAKSFLMDNPLIAILPMPRQFASEFSRNLFMRLCILRFPLYFTTRV